MTSQLATTLSSVTPVTSVTHGKQVLSFKGLRFNAELGILPEEHKATQPIEVNAQLNMGEQPLTPEHDDICNVLDYRKVRELIIETCTAKRCNLLESLIGEVSHALMGLPNVVGVRVQIIKLEVFDDCEVAIQMDAGTW